MTFISVQNNGTEIIQTNFWNSSVAKAGKFYLSINAGCIRVLLPDQMSSAVNEMQGSDYVIVTQGSLHGKLALEMLWEDHSKSPFCLYTSVAAMDRGLPAIEAGREIQVSVYTKKGKAQTFKAHLRVAPLPCLKPLRGK